MATIGNTAAPTAHDNTGDYALAIPFTMTEDGTLTALSAYCYNSVGAATVIVGLYSNNAGVPGAKIADTGNLTESLGSPDGALVSGSASGSLVNGTQYWLVFSVFSGANSGNHKVGKTAGGTFLFRASNGLPADNNWSVGDFGSSSGTICAFATYTPSGGGGSIADDDPGYIPPVIQPVDRLVTVYL